MPYIWVNGIYPCRTTDFGFCQFMIRFMHNNKTLLPELPDITGALRSAVVMLYDPDATA